MSSDAELAKLARLGGILPRYTDMQQRVRVTTPDTQRALLGALGIAADSAAAVRESLTEMAAQGQQRRFPSEVIVDSAQPAELSFVANANWVVLDEGETEICAGPADAPILLPPLASGIYHLRMAASEAKVRILAAPRRLATVEALTGQSHLWGINLALYGLRSARNHGLGDYSDLAQMSRLAAEKGAGFVGVNPIHNMGYADPSISPYSPSHRGFLNTRHIALDHLPGLESSSQMQRVLTGEHAVIDRLRASNKVPYPEHQALFDRAMAAAFPLFMSQANKTQQGNFQAFLQTGGADLETFARFEALSETCGPDWRDWPAGHPPTPDQTRVQFHKWLQWLADEQLIATRKQAQEAGLSLGLYLDLAVGPRRGGAESWCEQGCIAQGVSIGAPPDHLSPEGQNWDLAAFAPRRLQEADYRPLRRILAQTMRHAGVIRIDHVLGLARSFLVPDDGVPGGYVEQPLGSLVAVIKIEAERNNCAVIGEDLGLVPENFRETMRDHGFYGYSVLQYEDLGAQKTSSGNPNVLSCFATHDTPTVRGYESGRDLEWWHHLGWITEDDLQQARVRRNREVAVIRQLAKPAPDFQSAVLAILARSPAHMISIQLDDIMGSVEAQNLPGTIDQHPNWRRKAPIPLEELAALTAFRETAAAVAHTRSVHKEDARNVIQNH